ncbi:MAG: glycosyltransferase, partial [Gammaproteobacteria bacterium]
MDTKSISVVIPAYKSETTLPLLVERLDRVLTENIGNHEIIIIDDGSDDGSQDVIRQTMQENP